MAITVAPATRGCLWEDLHGAGLIIPLYFIYNCRNTVDPFNYRSDK